MSPALSPGKSILNVANVGSIFHLGVFARMLVQYSFFTIPSSKYYLLASGYPLVFASPTIAEASTFNK